VLQQRLAAPVGDDRGAVANVVEHYEQWGHSALRLLAQEDRMPELKVVADLGRATHAEWVDHRFGAFLGGGEREYLRGLLIVLTDVYVWKLLRLDQGLSRQETETQLLAMVEAILSRRRER
jgi:hypothetical protein